MENNLKDAADAKDATVGEMHKRREKMADGKRYIIYYTFGDGGGEAAKPQTEVKENV